jgi:hypothetical protein
MTLTITLLHLVDLQTISLFETSWTATQSPSAQQKVEQAFQRNHLATDSTVSVGADISDIRDISSSSVQVILDSLKEST